MATVTAKGPFLGYDYQEICALWAMLKLDDNLELSVEKFDDYSLDKNDKPKQKTQTKHHLGSTKLTNTSIDLWKTIGNWSTEYFLGLLNPLETKLVLVTTSVAPPNSIASKLNFESGKYAEATKELIKIAESDLPLSNVEHYKKFLKLDDYYRHNLIENIIIIDDQPQINELIEKIQKKLEGWVPKKYEQLLLNQILGWWHKRIIKHLTESEQKPISRTELHSQIRDIVMQTGTESLPIFEFNEDEMNKISNQRIFLRQLDIIDLETSKKNAKRNYYLIQKHRSEWTRYDPLIQKELNKFEKLLHDDWDEHFSNMKQKVGTKTAEKTRKRLGQELFEWANNKSDYLYMRPQTRDVFIRRGTFHILSDKKIVGWHPDYKEIIPDA